MKGRVRKEYSYEGTKGVIRTTETKKEVELFNKLSRWKVGSTVTVVVDCIFWRVVFWMGDSILGKTEIEKNYDYRPFVKTCSCHCNGGHVKSL